LREQQLETIQDNFLLEWVELPFALFLT